MKIKNNFEIGQFDGYDNCYDWIIPFNMMVDWSATELEGDGDTEGRSLKIVAFSENMITSETKHEIKANVYNIINDAKNKIKKLYLKHIDETFDVMYKKHDLIERQSYIKIIVEFKIIDG